MTSRGAAPLTNWAGNLTFAARQVNRPTSVEALQEVVAGAAQVRAIGTAHSFSSVADAMGDLVSVTDLPHTVEIDEARRTVRVSAGTRYGELAAALHAAGWALHNLGSLPHISVAGAVATSTHGSGDRLGNLATAVVGVELVTADGELRTWSRHDNEEFAGVVVALGTLGVVTHLTLEVQPTYDVAQVVLEHLPLRALDENLDEVTGAARSVSLFTDWQGGTVDQVWLKTLVRDGAVTTPSPGWLGTTPADGPRHPLPGVSAEHCTQQLGVPGPWHERLAHFRLDFTPSSGEELQSEYLVAREHGADAIAAVEGVRDHVTPALQVCELRTVAADDLWLSPSFERDSLAIHFTWRKDPAAVEAAAAYVEAALAPFAPRPHWGKLFWVDSDEIAARYPRLGDARALRRRLDPSGKLRNAFTDRFIGW